MAFGDLLYTITETSIYGLFVDGSNLWTIRSISSDAYKVRSKVDGSLVRSSSAVFGSYPQCVFPSSDIDAVYVGLDSTGTNALKVATKNPGGLTTPTFSMPLGYKAYEVVELGSVVIAKDQAGNFRRFNRSTGSLLSTVANPSGYMNMTCDGSYFYASSAKTLGKFDSNCSLVDSHTFASGTGDGQVNTNFFAVSFYNNMYYIADNIAGNAVRIQRFDASFNFVDKILTGINSNVRYVMADATQIYVLMPNANAIKVYNAISAVAPNAPTLLTATCISGLGESTLSAKPESSFTYDPDTGLFTDTSVNTPTSWFWDFGDGTTSTEQNPDHELAPGIHDVSLTVTNASGTTTQIITIVVPDLLEVVPPLDAPDAVMGQYIQASDGNYHFIDTVNDLILVYDSGLVYQGFYGGHGTGDGEFDGATSIIEYGGYIYIVDSGNHRVEKFGLDGSYVSQFGVSSLINPFAIATNGIYFYISDRTAKSIVVFDLLGNYVDSYSTGDHIPYGIVADINFIYIASYNKSQLLTMLVNGGELLPAFGEYGTGTDQFKNPMYLSLSGLTLIVDDSGNSRYVYYSVADNFLYGTLGYVDGTFDIVYDIHADLWVLLLLQADIQEPTQFCDSLILTVDIDYAWLTFLLMADIVPSAIVAGYNKKVQSPAIEVVL